MENNENTKIDKETLYKRVIYYLFILIILTIIFSYIIFYEKKNFIQVNQRIFLIFILMIPTIALVLIHNIFAIFFEDKLFKPLDEHFKIQNPKVLEIMNNTFSLILSIFLTMFIKVFIEKGVYSKYASKEDIDLLENNPFYNVVASLISGILFVVGYVYFTNPN